MANKDSAAVEVVQRRGTTSGGRRFRQMEEETPRRPKRVAEPPSSERKKVDDTDRCTFVTAKDDGLTATCREKFYCSICEYCSKHCLEHTGMTKAQLELCQNKKAFIET